MHEAWCAKRKTLYKGKSSEQLNKDGSVISIAYSLFCYTTNSSIVLPSSQCLHKFATTPSGAPQGRYCIARWLLVLNANGAEQHLNVCSTEARCWNKLATSLHNKMRIPSGYQYELLPCLLSRWCRFGWKQPSSLHFVMSICCHIFAPHSEHRSRHFRCHIFTFVTRLTVDPCLEPTSVVRPL